MHGLQQYFWFTAISFPEGNAQFLLVPQFADLSAFRLLDVELSGKQACRVGVKNTLPPLLACVGFEAD